VAVVSAILRFLAYLYHGLLALLLLALGTVLTIANAGNSVRLDMLPWSGSAAVWALLLGGIIGLTLVILAIRGVVRPLFFLWALIVVIMLIKGYFLSGYRFTPAEFDKVAYLLIGAFIALIGAFSQMFSRTSKR